MMGLEVLVPVELVRASAGSWVFPKEGSLTCCGGNGSVDTCANHNSFLFLTILQCPASEFSFLMIPHLFLSAAFQPVSMYAFLSKTRMSASVTL